MPLDFPGSPAINDTWTASNGVTYTWNGTMWTVAGSGSGTVAAANNVGRNLLHNGLFNIAQRGAGGFSTTGYTLDRWGSYFVNGSQVINQIANPDAGRAAIGDEASAFIVQANITGSATAGSVNEIYQCIEDVRRLAGKTVTLSLWAWMGSGSAKIGANVYQSFGSGGSPSASVFVPGQSITITATPARYSFTFTLPSTAGKTIGTNGNSFTGLNLYFSGATDQNTNTGSVGVQTGFFYLWGVQLEIGSVATPLEKPDPQVDLANCQRFYQTGPAIFFGYGAAAGTFSFTYPLPVTMRAAPTVVITNVGNINIGTVTGGALNSPYALYIQGLATAAGITGINTTFTASADL